MDFKDQDIWRALYAALVIAGVGLLGFAYYIFRLAAHDSDPWRYVLPGIVLLVGGFACGLFGVQMFVFRDDPDIWG